MWDRVSWLIGLCVLAWIGSRPAIGADVEFVGAYTIVGQATDEDAIDESMTGSLDLFFTWALGPGTLQAYVEGSSTVTADDVAARLSLSNADAGTATHRDGSGRVQLSELKYTRAWPSTRSLSVGLIDPSVYLDSTRIDNDENLQFLGASFVNNPTIEFPDYTLGVAAGLSAGTARRRWNVVLASSSGLADDPDRTYRRLFDPADDREGVFAGVELGWPTSRSLIRGGAWVDTSDHETLDATEADATNYGLYAVIGSSWGGWEASVRLGAANPDVAAVDGFASIGIQRGIGSHTVGLGAARSWSSSEAQPGGPDDGLQLEGYVSFRLGTQFYLTPSVQYLHDGSVGPSSSPIDGGVSVLNLRVHHVFSRYP